MPKATAGQGIGTKSLPKDRVTDLLATLTRATAFLPAISFAWNYSRAGGPVGRAIEGKRHRNRQKQLIGKAQAFAEQLEEEISSGKENKYST